MANEYVSKVVLSNGTTLIDLTGDTVTAADVLSGVTTHGKDGAPITGTCTYDSDTTNDTAAVGEILSGKTATPSWSQQVVSPDTGYTHLSQVTVAAIPIAYSDNSAGGQTVTIG